MKSDKRLDEVFRKGLPLVEVPPPPSQDWAAMARSAKQGVRAAAVRDRNTAFTVRWMKLLGGASAVLVAWYLALGPRTDVQPPARAMASTEMPTERAEFMGDGQSALTDIGNADPTGEPGTALAAKAAGVDDKMYIEAATTRSERIPEGDDESSHGGGNKSLTKMDQRARAFAVGGNEPSPTSRSGSGQGVQEALPAEAIGGGVDGRMDANMDASSAAFVPGSASSAATKEHLEALAILQPLAYTLPYTPNDPPKETATSRSTVAHWSVAPWFGLGHSTWTDPDSDKDALAQLNTGSEQPGSTGLRVQYAFDRRFAVITGIQYAWKGSLSGTVRSSPMVSTTYKLSGDYLEVPLSLKFTLPLENKDLYLRAGCVFQFNMHDGTDKVAMNDASSKKMSTLVLSQGSMGTALDIGIGAQFPLCHRVGLFIEPSYQFALSPVVKHPSADMLPVNPRINTFSLTTGLSFQFP